LTIGKGCRAHLRDDTGLKVYPQLGVVDLTITCGMCGYQLGVCNGGKHDRTVQRGHVPPGVRLPR
jgi:hypothetical protein